MTPHNLAVVFGPTVIRAPATEDVITSQGQINIFIELFITELFSIFPNEKPLNDDGTSIRSDDGDDEDGDDDGDEDLGSDEGTFLLLLWLLLLLSLSLLLLFSCYQAHFYSLRFQT